MRSFARLLPLLARGKLSRGSFGVDRGVIGDTGECRERRMCNSWGYHHYQESVLSLFSVYMLFKLILVRIDIFHSLTNLFQE